MIIHEPPWRSPALPLAALPPPPPPADDQRATLVALPPLTPEQRAAALEKAAAARKARAEIKERLKRSGASIQEGLSQGETDDVIGKMRVSAVLEAMPGVGKARAQ